MKALPELTKASERRIGASLIKVAELIENGDSPDEAIAKIASAEKIPAGHVRLMVRAYNTGRSLEHIRGHDTLEEKAAAFKLASASAVLERMWPTNTKTAAALYHDAAVSDDYSKSPDGWLTRRKHARVAPMTKSAASTLEPYPTYPPREAIKIARELQDLRRDASAARQTATGAAYAVVSTIDKVAEYFRTPYGVPFTVAQHNASIALGPRVNKLMQKVATDKTVYKRYKDEILVKRAKVLDHPVDWNAAPYTLIKAALDAVDAFADAQAKLGVAEKEGTDKRTALLRPFAVERTGDTILGSVWREKSAALINVDVDATSKQEDGGWKGLGMGLGAGMGSKLTGMTADAVKSFAPAGNEELVQKSLGKLSDPEHEDKLRAIRTQGMMHELMAGDPIISGYQPQQVLRAYNHLSEIAPRAMQTRVMAQAMLRQYLEQAGAMNQFDVGQLGQFNETLTNRDMPDALAKGGWRVGPMRGMGKPAPSESVSLAPAAGKPDFGQGLYSQLMRPAPAQKTSPAPSAPKDDKPRKPKGK